MSNEPLDLQVIEERIKDQVSELVSVGGAADFSSVKDIRGFRTPSVFVVPSKEKVENDKSRHTYQVFSNYAVIIAVKNYRDNAGKKAAEEARQIIGQVRTALIGWMPADRSFRSSVWLEGEILDYDANTLLWADVFQTNYFIQQGA